MLKIKGTKWGKPDGRTRETDPWNHKQRITIHENILITYFQEYCSLMIVHLPAWWYRAKGCLCLLLFFMKYSVITAFRVNTCIAILVGDIWVPLVISVGSCKLENNIWVCFSRITLSYLHYIMWYTLTHITIPMNYTMQWNPSTYTQCQVIH